MLGEVYKVLTLAGIFICVSYGVPQTRENFFKNVRKSPYFPLLERLELEVVLGKSGQADYKSERRSYEGRRTGPEEFPLHLYSEKTGADSGDRQGGGRGGR